MDKQEISSASQTQESPRCSVCCFWNKSTLKYGVCEKMKDVPGAANLHFIEPTTAQIAVVMTHKSALCNDFERRSGKYISNRTKLIKAKKNNPLLSSEIQPAFKGKSKDIKKPAHISVLEKLLKKTKDTDSTVAGDVS